MKTSDFDYHLPQEFIGQTPLEPRDHSRLLVIDRHSDSLAHAYFYQLGKYLHSGDVLVLNETRVIPARLLAHKIPSGGRVELLLLKRLDERTWEVWVKGKGLVPGKRIKVENGPEGEIAASYEGPRRRILFKESLDENLYQVGHVPLPPYIHEPLHDPQRYQTVYARQPGSVAAPTAGLHFTPRLITQLKERGVRFVFLTLHVGLDTFAPVSEEDPHKHEIHTEWCQVSPIAARRINQAHRQGGRVIAVGTTSVRTLECAAQYASKDEVVGEFEGYTDLFILPGYSFRTVDAMITNFHLPRSTLLMLVSAFAGHERVMHAYRTAMESGYRFYSFGDAMLIT